MAKRHLVMHIMLTIPALDRAADLATVTIPKRTASRRRFQPGP